MTLAGGALSLLYSLATILWNAQSARAFRVSAVVSSINRRCE
jgi:hypothetical protein